MGLFDSGTRMKSLGLQGDYSVHELGDRLYLFNPRKPTNRAIISAHGGHHLCSNVNQFNTPVGVTLNFYGADQTNLADPGLNTFFRQRTRAQPTEIIGPRGFCFDYILSKFQAAPGPGAESYDSISTVIAQEVATLQRVQNRRDAYRRAGRAQMAQVQADQEAMYPMAAVITVRNRRFSADMTLQQLLAAVTREVPRLTVFDCLFCRGRHYWSPTSAVQYA